MRPGCGVFKENQGDQCGWNKVGKGESDHR